MFAVLLHEFLDELVRKAEVRVLPPALTMTLQHQPKDLLSTGEQFELGIAHLLEALCLQLPHTGLLYLLHPRDPSAFQQREQLVIFDISQKVFLELALEFGHLEEVHHI